MFKQDPSLADIAYLMKLGGIAPLLADPPQWNSITRQNLPNQPLFFVHCSLYNLL